MATYYSQGSAPWSTLANWDTVAGGGGTDPASVADMDDDAFIIQAGHTVTLDVDMSEFANGIAGLTINGGATPGMLACKYDADGKYYLMVKTGTNLAGTTSTNRGRLLGNSDGVWGNSGALLFGRKFIIDLKGTAKVDALNLDIALYDTEPGISTVATYLDIKTVTGSASADTLTNNGHGWANATPLMFRVTGGSLPAPLVNNVVYYVVGTATNTFQVASVSGGTALDLTTDGSGTIEAYSGHASTSTGIMNALVNVTADPQWVAGAAVVLVDANAPESYDQQRTTVSSVASGTITLAVNVDSAQFPGALIILVERNIAIRNNGTSSTQAIVDWGAATFTGSYLRCEIRNTAGSGTTFYGYGINAGTGHTISGSVSGCSTGIYLGTGHTISGSVSGCTSGIYGGANHIITSSAAIGFTSSGAVAPNLYSARISTTIDGPVNIISRGARWPSPPTYSGRNAAGDGRRGIYFEDYGQIVGAHRAELCTGDVIKDTVTVRSGGGSSSLQVVPLSACTSGVERIPIFEWTEFDVPAASQIRGVYILGAAWVVFPTAAELWFEAEYLSAGSGTAKTTLKSTAVLTDNTTWTKFSVTFTPSQVGPVRYRAFLGKYETASTHKVNVDNMLVTS